MIASSIVCGGCGAEVPPSEPYPFRCPRAGELGGYDHVLRRVLNLEAVAFPDGPADETFVHYRHLLHPYHLGITSGMSDADLVSLLQGLDDAVAKVDGRGFVPTPFETAPPLAARIGLGGDLFVKDETRNVSGSQKARHLFGILFHLEVMERLGLVPMPAPPLAIASCGNAALAAAVVASAAGRRLQVFVPPDASPVVLRRLTQLGADVVVCERDPAVPGDPTYHRLLQALDEGAIPFTCQGNLNGLAIEGGETLGWEMASSLAATDTSVDHVFIQVGGGALASSVAQSLREAVDLGALESMPAVHTVQTEGAAPLQRAYEHVAALLAAAPSYEDITAALATAAARRCEFMWPWEAAPHSIAHGILDDETYDWLAVVEAMLRTGGRPVVVSEGELVGANRLAVEATGIDVDETGSAGLAGLIQLVREGAISGGESAAVLFTGVRR